MYICKYIISSQVKSTSPKGIGRKTIINYSALLAQYARTCLRQILSLEIAAWKAAVESNICTACLFISVPLSSFGRPQRQPCTAGSTSRPGSKTRFLTGHAAGRRASLPKKPSCCSRRCELRALAFIA